MKKKFCGIIFLMMSYNTFANECLENYIKGLRPQDEIAWNKLEDVSKVPGLAHEDAMRLRVYLHSVPHDLRQKLMTKFRAQSKEATLKDLEAMRDLHRINGGCK